MANIYTLLDYGNYAVIEVDGVTKAYSKIGSGLNVPTDNTPIQQSISGFTYNVADAQNKTVYTACEHAVSRYVPDNYVAEAPPVNWVDDFFVAPSNGVIRIWTTGGFNASVRINGISVGVSGNSGMANGVPWNLASGDIVTCFMADYVVYSTFLPASYE